MKPSSLPACMRSSRCCWAFSRSDCRVPHGFLDSESSHRDLKRGSWHFWDSEIVSVKFAWFGVNLLWWIKTNLILWRKWKITSNTCCKGKLHLFWNPFFTSYFHRSTRKPKLSGTGVFVTFPDFWGFPAQLLHGTPFFGVKVCNFRGSLEATFEGKKSVVILFEVDAVYSILRHIYRQILINFKGEIWQ